MGSRAERRLGHADHRNAERGVRMRPEAGPAIGVKIGDPGYRAELLARLGERPIPEASDSNFAWYADEVTLIADDLRRGYVSNVLQRGS
jgi:hypothetical protein